jgi:hypothetical protein
MTDKTAPPAGWYPDPATPGQSKWWDGESWTEHLQPAPSSAYVTTPGVPHEPAQVPNSLPSKPRNVLAIWAFWIGLGGLVLFSPQLVVLRFIVLVPALVLAIVAVANKQGLPRTMAIWALCFAGLGLLSAMIISIASQY